MDFCSSRLIYSYSPAGSHLTTRPVSRLDPIFHKQQTTSPGVRQAEYSICDCMCSNFAPLKTTSLVPIRHLFRRRHAITISHASQRALAHPAEHGCCCCIYGFEPAIFDLTISHSDVIDIGDFVEPQEQGYVEKASPSRVVEQFQIDDSQPFSLMTLLRDKVKLLRQHK